MLTEPELDISGLSGQDRVLFEIAPAPIWLEDWSAVASFCDDRRGTGTRDLRTVLENDETLLREVVSTIHVIDVNGRAAKFVGATRRELMGRLPGELLNKGTLASLIDQILVVWEGATYLELEVSGVTMGGADIASQLSWAAPLQNGEPDYASVVVMMRDVSQHRAAEEAMRRNVERLETLLDMGRGIASTFDIDIILELLAETTTSLLDADQCLILLFDTVTERVTRRASHGVFDIPVPEPTYEEIMNRLPGWVSQTREATLTNDIALDERTLVLPPPLDVVFAGRRAAIAPILVDDCVLGTVTAMNGPGAPEFTGMDLSLVRMLAMQAAVAIHNASMYDELRSSRDNVQAAHESLKHTQTQLLAAQKMEAIGGLAAGIAHEINTPIQFVSDNTSFIRDAAVTLAKFGQAHIALLDRLVDDTDVGAEVTRLRQEWKDQDCDFLLEEMPDAIDETIEGAQRVSEIVRAMKEFAHPGSQAKSSVDVNRVIQTTMKVSRNEWKYYADLELDLDENIPMIEGHAGPLGQSLLIMFVNSAQAISEHRSIDSQGKGTVKVSTRHTDEVIEIRIADNGPGIPEDIVERIFEPFFTTKDVGKGSGQGLSIAHSVVVDKHQGKIWVENSDPGAVFVIQLPIKDPARGAEEEDF